MFLAGKRLSGFLLVVLIEGGLAVLALLLGWALGVPLIVQLWPTGRAMLIGLAAMLPMLATFWWLVRVDWPAARRLRQQVEELIRELFPHPTVFQLLAVSLLAGLGEELLFRGVVQSVVARWSTPIMGLAVASIVFGAFHAVSVVYFALATMAGAYLGWIVLASQDLLPAIVAHGIYDFIALLYLSQGMFARDAGLAKSQKVLDERSSD
jgi:uncharacterized protein